MNQIATRVNENKLGVIPRDLDAEQSILGSILLNSKLENCRL